MTFMALSHPWLDSSLRFRNCKFFIFYFFVIYFIFPFIFLLLTQVVAGELPQRKPALGAGTTLGTVSLVSELEFFESFQVRKKRKHWSYLFMAQVFLAELVHQLSNRNWRSVPSHRLVTGFSCSFMMWCGVEGDNQFFLFRRCCFLFFFCRSLDHNLFTQTVPTEFFSLHMLQYLHFHNNQMVGTISEEFGRQFPSLIDL